MDTANYKSIVEHYQTCFEKHGATAKGVDWPNARDHAKRCAIMLDLAAQEQAFSLLDFGCGYGFLYAYLQEQGRHDVDYIGLDLSEPMIAHARRSFPQATFLCVDALQEPERLPQCDYVVLNGVLTERQTLTHEQMREYAFSLIEVLFATCKKGLAFNVMSKHVDWEREDLFHLPEAELLPFVVQKLTRHFVIRNDYGLYEYSVYLYKEAQV